MKFKIFKTVLTTAIQTVEGAVATKTTLPILSNVLIEASKDKILFNATDLDIGIIYCSKAEVIEEGNITVPAKRFADIVRELPDGEITITVKKNFNMIIDCDSCSFRLIGLPKEEFPTIPKFNNNDNVIIQQAVLKKLLKKVSFAMSRDETRYVLNGTLFMLKNKILRLVATDGKRLALIESALPLEINKKEAIIPIKTINELNKIFDVWEICSRPTDKPSIPPEIEEMAKLRLDAKKQKNFAESDRLRNAIQAMGFSVKDTKDGYILERI